MGGKLKIKKRPHIAKNSQMKLRDRKPDGPPLNYFIAPIHDIETLCNSATKAGGPVGAPARPRARPLGLGGMRIADEEETMRPAPMATVTGGLAHGSIGKGNRRHRLPPMYHWPPKPLGSVLEHQKGPPRRFFTDRALTQIQAYRVSPIFPMSTFLQK